MQLFASTDRSSVDLTTFCILCNFTLSISFHVLSSFFDSIFIFVRQLSLLSLPIFSFHTKSRDRETEKICIHVLIRACDRVLHSFFFRCQVSKKKSFHHRRESYNMSTKTAGKPKKGGKSLTSELNRQLQALQSDKDCLILENRRLLKKIEVLEEIKTALRAQEGKAAAKAAMSIELEHSLRDMKMRLEVSEQKLANAQKMKIGVDELRAQLAKVELDSLELKDKISSLENLKDDMKSKVDSQESLLKEMWTHGRTLEEGTSR